MSCDPSRRRDHTSTIVRLRVQSVTASDDRPCSCRYLAAGNNALCLQCCVTLPFNRSSSLWTRSACINVARSFARCSGLLLVVHLLCALSVRCTKYNGSLPQQ